jgi:sugar phosphate isomerase/epimerase
MKQPRELDGNDLVLSHFSLDRYHPIEDRVRAASAAGFDSIGLYIEHYRQLADEGYAPEQLKELLTEHDLTLSEIDVLRSWATDAATSDDYLAMEATAWEMADRFDCRYIQAIGPYDGTIENCGQAFGALCDRAADHGLVVGLEFLPFTNIYDANDGMRVVEAADRDNGGLCVDIWHHTRGSNDLDQIRAIPGDKVMCIQMNDGPNGQQLDDYVQDCLRTRVPTGEGTFDVAGFVGALIDLGANVPWSMEVCNDAVWGQPATAHCIAIADAMRSTLKRCRRNER